MEVLDRPLLHVSAAHQPQRSPATPTPQTRVNVPTRALIGRALARGPGPAGRPAGARHMKERPPPRCTPSETSGTSPDAGHGLAPARRRRGDRARVHAVAFLQSLRVWLPGSLRPDERRFTSDLHFRPRTAPPVGLSGVDHMHLAPTRCVAWVPPADASPGCVSARAPRAASFRADRIDPREGG
jgi:hypothetical protein